MYLVGVQSDTVAAVAGRLVAYVSFGGGEYDAGEAALDRGSPKVAALVWWKQAKWFHSLGHMHWEFWVKLWVRKSACSFTLPVAGNSTSCSRRCVQRSSLSTACGLGFLMWILLVVGSSKLGEDMAKVSRWWSVISFWWVTDRQVLQDRVSGTRRRLKQEFEGLRVGTLTRFRKQCSEQSSWRCL